MKNFILMAAALVLGFTLSVGDAEAKRLGGGGSFGMQRQSVAPSKSYSQAAPAKAPQQAGAATTPPKRSWMGPLAGLAAGLGLAALASHFGFGEGMANFMLIALLAVGAVMLFRFLTRSKAGAPAGGMQYAGAGANYGGPAVRPELSVVGGSSIAGSEGSTGNIPADFDSEAFVRNAKVSFIRLQAANDAANLDDIREFTSPEMFAEIKMEMGDRKAGQQETDVVQLNAEVLDVAEEASRYVVSVHFSGLIREDKDAAAVTFGEVWHMTKPIDGSRGWVLSGIQQVQ